MSNLQDIINRVSKRVFDKRNQLGYSLRSFSKKTGVSIALISAIENGQRFPSLKTLEVIATGLNMTLSDMLAVKIEGSRDKKKVLLSALSEYGISRANCDILLELADFLKSKQSKHWYDKIKLK